MAYTAATMKFAILSDIHANLEALEAVIADARSMGVSGFINLGDSVGYGPDPEAVTTRLALLQAASVRGNHDQALFRPSLLARLSTEARESLAHAARTLSAGTRLWLSLLPATLVLHGARFVHGMPPSSIMRYLSHCEEAELRKRFNGFAEDLCFVGHTHKQEMVRLTPAGELLASPLFDGRHQLPERCRHICNIGSVGQPRGQVKGAEYAVWKPSTRELIPRKVPYDAEPVKVKMRQYGLPESLCRWL